MFTHMMPRCFAIAMAVALILILGGCASAPKPSARLGLMLSPVALGEAVSVQQRLTVERDGRTDDLDVALQVEPDAIDMVGLAMGQRVLTLRYDGDRLTSWRHFMLPSQVRAEDVLEDMQLTLWPRAAIAAALPDGWQIDEDEQGHRRIIYLDKQPVMRITYSSMPRWSGTVILENLRYHYKLTIQFAPNND